MDASGSTADAGSTDAGSLGALNVGETCAYMSPSPYTGCRMPRSCQSCLATAGCMIDEGGSCVSVEDEPVDADKDYRLAMSEGLVLPNATADGVALSAKQAWQFPAGRVKYCGMSDATCLTCTRANFWRSRSSSPDSRYCVGADGACVCIDVCERRWFVQQDCSSRRGYGGGMYAPSATPTGGSSSTSTNTTISETSIVNRVWQAMVGSIVFVMVVLGFVLWTRRKSELQARRENEERRRRAQARRERRQTTADQLGVNALSLSGWDAYRRDLIEKEIAQLSGGGELQTTTPATVHDVESDDHDEPGDAGERGHTAAYVRMAEAEDERAGTRSTETLEETGDGAPAASTSGPSERTTATLAPLTVSQTLQPRW